MKFVYNAEKAEWMRHILMMQPTIEEAKELLEKDNTDAYAWYVYGTALALQKDNEEAIEAYSRGILCDPFYGPNYFGRGRKLNLTGHYWAAMADFSTAIRLDPTNWKYWYYRATTQNLAGYLEESIDDFLMCIKLTAEYERFPLVDWLYNTNVELGRYEEAEKSLDLMDVTTEALPMHYGYARTVRLFKGLIKPEEFIDIADMEKSVLPRKGRVELELNGMYYGLYNYWILHGDEEKAYDAIRELQKIAVPSCFGYKKSVPIAKKLGLIEE